MDDILVAGSMMRVHIQFDLEVRFFIQVNLAVPTKRHPINQRSILNTNTVLCCTVLYFEKRNPRAR
jgi:hypothetical protein